MFLKKSDNFSRSGWRRSDSVLRRTWRKDLTSCCTPAPDPLRCMVATPKPQKQSRNWNLEFEFFNSTKWYLQGSNLRPFGLRPKRSALDHSAKVSMLQHLADGSPIGYDENVLVITDGKTRLDWRGRYRTRTEIDSEIYPKTKNASKEESNPCDFHRHWVWSPARGPPRLINAATVPLTNSFCEY